MSSTSCSTADETLVSLRAENRGQATSSHNYAVFGLTISSSLACPELLEADSEAEADVTVRYGNVPRQLEGASSTGVRHQAMPGQLLLRVDGVARFLIRNANEIVVDRDLAAGDDDVRLFLLGSAFGALLHQRGYLVLRGSVVKVGDGCAVFLGKSGAGKSTLAAALGQRGYACYSDDVCVVAIGKDGVPYAVPAYAQANLWPDSIQRLGVDVASLRRVRPSLEKRAWPLVGPPNEERVPVRRLFVLSPSREADRVSLRPVEGPAKMSVLRAQTYRGRFLRGLDLEVAQFRLLAHLCARASVIGIVRPQHAFLLDELVGLVEGNCQS